MISAIFINFQAILNKSTLAAVIFLRALSNPFFKSKKPLGYPWPTKIHGHMSHFEGQT